MSAISFGYQPMLREASQEASRRPWGLAILLLFCFTLTMGEYDASRKWKTTQKGDVQSLKDRVSEGQLRRQAGFLILGAAGLYGVIRPMRRALRADLALTFSMIALVSWACLSIVWSQDRLLTAKRMVVLISMTLMVVAIVRHYTMRDLAFVMVFVGLATLILGVFCELLFGDHSLSFAAYRYSGTMHPNHSAIVSIMLLYGALYFADETKQRRYLFIAGLAFLELLLTKSRTALLAGVAGASIFVLLRWPWKTILTGGIGVTIFVLLIGLLHHLAMLPAVWEAILLGREDSDPTTLTGRTAIWEFAIKQLDRDPSRMLVGFGYDSFWTPEMAEGVSKTVRFKISEGHCAYLDSILMLGVIGLGLHLTNLLRALYRWGTACKGAMNAVPAMGVALIVYTLVHGIAESSSIAPIFATLVTFTAMAFAALRDPHGEGSFVKGGESL